MNRKINKIIKCMNCVFWDYKVNKYPCNECKQIIKGVDHYAEKKKEDKMDDLINIKKSLCGYDINYLVAFATICEKAGVNNDDLKEFVGNYKYVFNMAIKAVVDSLTKNK